MQEAFSIIDELEEAVSSGSSAKRVTTLRRVTDLFLHNGECLSDDQVKVFADVLCHLVTRVETPVKAELSGVPRSTVRPLESLNVLHRTMKSPSPARCSQKRSSYPAPNVRDDRDTPLL
jgi:hypothetical protein